MVDKKIIIIFILSICNMLSLALISRLFAYAFLDYTEVSYNVLKNYTIVTVCTGAAIGIFFMLIVPMVLEKFNKNNGDDNNNED